MMWSYAPPSLYLERNRVNVVTYLEQKLQYT
jgi:hypothetical protein